MERIKSKKIVFLDRDGVINKKADEHCYITKVSDFIFNEDIFALVTKLKAEGFEFIIITNQRGVARGLYTEEQLDEIHQHMKEGFNKHGIEILDVFYCPHENNVCDCRKPKAGMLQHACDKYEIDLPNSLLISDSKEEVSMGQKFGIGRNIFIPSDQPVEATKQLLTKEPSVLA